MFTHQLSDMTRMSIPSKRPPAESGLTLLEVLVAMVIMTVALLLLVNMGMVALYGNDWSNKTTVANQLMQEKLEQLRYSPNPANGTDTVRGVIRRWRVAEADHHLREASVAVTWADFRTRTVTDSVSTFIHTDST